MFDTYSIYDNDCCTCCFLVCSINHFVFFCLIFFDIMMNRIFRFFLQIWNDDKKETCKNDDNVGGISLHFHFLFIYFKKMI